MPRPVRGGYAQSLDDLAKPAAGGAQLFISPDIPRTEP